MADDKQIAKRIRSIREKKNLTQEQLSEMVGLNSKYWSEFERGKETISLKNLNKASHAMEVPLPVLVDAEHEAPRQQLEDEVTKMMHQANDEQMKTIYRLVTVVVR